MTDIENNGPETPQTTSSIISDKNLAYAQDVIGDFVKYARVNNDGDFSSENNYNGGTKIIGEREKGDIDGGLLNLLGDLESPDTAANLLSLLGDLKMTEDLKLFLADDLVKKYFNNLDKFDAITPGNFKNNEDLVGSAKNYKEYKKIIDGVKDKYQKLLVGVEGDKKDTNVVEEGKKELISIEELYFQIEELLSGKEILDIDVKGLDKRLYYLPFLRDQGFRKKLIEGYQGNLSVRLAQLESSLENNKKDKKDTKEVKLEKKTLDEQIKGEIKSIKDELEKFDPKSFEKLLGDIEARVLGANVTDLLSQNLTADEIIKNVQLQKTLNTAFHFDRGQYDVLVSSYENQKESVQESVFAYIKLMNQGLQIEGLESDIKSSDIVLGKELNTSLSTADFDEDKFYITKDLTDENGVVSKKVYGLEKDSAGKSKLVEVEKTAENKLAAYFGDSEGNPWTLDALSQLKPGSDEAKALEWVMSNDPKASSLFKDSEDGMKIASGREINKLTGKQANVYANFGDALNAFFDTSMWDQIKILFLALGAVGSTEEKDRDQAQLQIDYIKTTAQLRKEFLPDGKTRYSSVLSAKYEPSSKDPAGGDSYKRRFVDGSLALQKAYIDACLKGGRKAGYEILISGSTIDTKTETPKEDIVGAGGVDTKTDIPLKIVELLSGAGTADDLRITPASSGKVELVSDEDSAYLLVDGQVVSLLSLNDSLSVGSLFVETKPGEVQEKKVTLSTVDGKQTIAIENVGNPLDVSDSTNGEKKKEVFKNNVMKYPKEGINNEQLPMRNYFAWSAHGPAKTFYDTITQITDDSVRKSIQKSLAIAQASVDAIAGELDQSTLQKDVHGAIEIAKRDMLDAGNNLDPSLVSAINDWAAMFGVEEKTSS